MKKNRVIVAALLATSFVASAVPALARDHDDSCEARVHKAEQKLHEAERKHGEHSRQAEKKREELEHARASCGDRH